FLRNASPSADQRYADSRKCFLRQLFDRDRFAPKLELFSRGARRGQQRQFPHRKIALLERFHHLDADCSGRADYGHMRFAIHIKGREYTDRAGACQFALETRGVTSVGHWEPAREKAAEGCRTPKPGGASRCS